MKCNLNLRKYFIIFFFNLNNKSSLFSIGKIFQNVESFLNVDFPKKKELFSVDEFLKTTTKKKKLNKQKEREK